MFLVQNHRSKRSWRVFARRTLGTAVSERIRATREFGFPQQYFSDRLLVQSTRHHHTLWIRVLYALTIILVLALVTKLQ